MYLISDNFKFKGKELFYLIIVTLPPLLLLFVPNYAAIFIGIDSWMIFVLIAAIDMVFAYITVKIGMLAKGKTVIGMCKYAFGNMIGIFSVRCSYCFSDSSRSCFSGSRWNTHL